VVGDGWNGALGGSVEDWGGAGKWGGRCQRLGDVEEDRLGVLRPGAGSQQVKHGEGVGWGELGAETFDGGLGDEGSEHLDDLGADQGRVMGAGGWCGHG
jgi:hypothetical protein